MFPVSFGQNEIFKQMLQNIDWQWIDFASNGVIRSLLDVMCEEKSVSPVVTMLPSAKNM